MLCNSKYYTTYHMKNNYMTLKKSTMRHIYGFHFPRSQKCIPCIVLASLALAPNTPTPNTPTPNTQP